MAQPIWRDYYVVLGTSGVPVLYRISVYEDAEWVPIFNGKAYPRPGWNEVKAKINNICADYLTRAWPSPTQDDWYSARFKVETYDGSAWTEADDVTFARDWSYDDTFIVGTDVPVAPVSEFLNPGQLLPIFSDTGEFEAHIQGGDFNDDFNDDFSNSGWYTDNYRDGYTYMLDLRDYPGWRTITANGRKYKAANLCGGYVLYYINAFGGWDSLPVTGRAVQFDDLERYTKDNDYNNGSYEARGTENYVNVVKERYRLNIGPLTSDQSSRMHHLVGSTFVYLHDLAKDRVFPVTLTVTSEERKTRAGILHTYQIEAVVSQDRTRR